MAKLSILEAVSYFSPGSCWSFQQTSWSWQTNEWTSGNAVTSFNFFSFLILGGVPLTSSQSLFNSNLKQKKSWQTFSGATKCLGKCTKFWRNFVWQATTNKTWSPERMILAGDSGIFEATIATDLGSCLDAHLHAWDQSVVSCQLHFCLANGPQGQSQCRSNLIEPDWTWLNPSIHVTLILADPARRCLTRSHALLTTNHSRPVQPPLTLSASDQSKTLIMPRTGIVCLRRKAETHIFARFC